MTIYDFIDQLLKFLELGTWNGSAILPRQPLGDQEKILLIIMIDSIADLRKILGSDGRTFQERLTASDFRMFLFCQANNFWLYPQVKDQDVAPHDFEEAKRMMIQSLRTIREQYPLELV